MKGYIIKNKDGFLVGTKCRADGAVVLAFFEYKRHALSELKHGPKGAKIVKAELNEV